MSALEGFTPGQIARLDQEHQQTRQVLAELVAEVRGEFVDVPSAEAFVVLLEQLARIEGRTKILALFTQALMDLAAADWRRRNDV